jgi:hypothetical protein
LVTKRPFIGVATTTQVACLIDKTLLLEPMNVLADDGCGVPTTTPAPIGKTLAIAFRLSSSKRTIYCQAEVIGDVATTPGGLALKSAHGEDAFHDAMSMKDSATSIVRREDIEKMRRQAKAAGAKASTARTAASAVDTTFPTAPSKGPPSGFCLRFRDLTPDNLQLVRAHIQQSREIEARLAIGSVEESSDRKQGLFFDDPKLSDKANDW